MDVYIYLIEPCPCGIDELEDALAQALGDIGEVTGSGTGGAGSNIDVFIEDDALSDGQVLDLLREAIADYGIPGSTRVVIDGRPYPWE